MSKRRGWKTLAVISWLIVAAIAAHPLLVEYGFAKPLTDPRSEGSMLVIVLFVFLVGIISTIASFPSNAEEMRAEEIREDAHMQRCRHGSECYHPDHVHAEPEPFWYDEHLAALEEIWRPRGFFERMGS